MNDYVLKPARQVDCYVLHKKLTELRIPFHDDTDRQSRLIRIGPDCEYEVRTMTGRGNRLSKATVAIRYEHPVLTAMLVKWLENCGVEAPEDFYKWHLLLSPSVLRAIRERWRVDLSNLPATPITLGKHVLAFMFGKNVSEELSAQLADIPHKRMQKGEFIKCDEFSITGEDPTDTEVYRWVSDAGSQLLVTESSAPVMTLLTLWVVSEGAPVEIKIDDLPSHQ